MSDSRVDEVVNAIEDGETAYVRLALGQFEAAYNRLLGANSEAPVDWILLFLGDQVAVQVLGHPNTRIEIGRDSGQSYFTESEFAFVDRGHALFYGSRKGKYEFSEFVKDVFGRVGVRIGVELFVLGLLIAEYYLPWKASGTLANAIMVSLSMFLSIFVLFSLSIDPEREYPYLTAGRYRKLAETDRHIAMIALATLGLAIVAVVLTAGDGYPVGDIHRLPASIVLSLGSVLTLGCYWLAVNYHFSRKHEMAENRMAKVLLSNTQKVYLQQKASGTGQPSMMTPTDAD
jgi:hypothetical protein